LTSKNQIFIDPRAIVTIDASLHFNYKSSISVPTVAVL